jgi:hypothetical protein
MAGPTPIPTATWALADANGSARSIAIRTKRKLFIMSSHVLPVLPFRPRDIVSQHLPVEVVLF